MAEVTVSGVLYRRFRSNGEYRRSYVAFLADGKLVRDVGSGGRNEKRADGVKIVFRRVLRIVGKHGPSGLEGSRPDGGSWFMLTLVPSREERTISLRLPGIEVVVQGNFDVYGEESCEWRSLDEFVTYA